MRSWLVFPALVVALLACDADRESGSESAPMSERESWLGPFLSAHWELPVAPQGPPPPGFSQPEASLDPAVCGSCHPVQFAEWRTSLHAAAFSPGFGGQLIEGDLAHPAEVRNCQTCHAPLAEQQPWDLALDPSAVFDQDLRVQGIVCASCHVRAHRRLGPPRREDLPALVEPVPHGGFEERGEYLESRFCGPCHQFFDDAGPSGKSLENTLFEWSESPQAAAGRHCQDCHMPGRAHLWRGIHDPEMVRSGVDSDLLLVEAPAGTVAAVLVVANRDVGHAFPTYVTPRVLLAVYQVDDSGAEIAGSWVEATIGREVDLRVGRERFDTRVLPGESAKLEYAKPRAAGSVALVGRVTVDPDFHYRGVFASLLTLYRDEAARERIAEALRRISDSAYVLSEIRLDLADSS